MTFRRAFSINTDVCIGRIKKVGELLSTKDILQPSDCFIHRISGIRHTVLRSFPISSPKSKPNSSVIDMCAAAASLDPSILRSTSFRLLLENETIWNSKMTKISMGLGINEVIYIAVQDLREAETKGTVFVVARNAMAYIPLEPIRHPLARLFLGKCI